MENNRVEYKIDIPEKQNKLKAEIVSFLNSEGGEIYLGVNDDKTIDTKLIESKRQEWEQLISNWVANAFSPDVTNLIFINSNDVPFKIKVLEGKNKPYFYKDGEGFNSKGVYIRVGSTKRVASFEEIQRMIRQHTANDFESITIERSDLTFDYLEKRFKEKGIIFNPLALSLVDKNGKYNNAALLLSDQNPTISKFAVFQGTGVSIFLDKKEFTGSILKQLDDILYFAYLSNRKKIIISGKLERDEYLDIPEKALREAIVNCYCHRDYTLSGDIKIEFYDDRVQIFSPGSLPDGLTFENIKTGMVAKRNKIIVNTFNKIDVIENYASGVRRIFEDYIGFKKQPQYHISNNGVIVTLFNRNYESTNDEIESKIDQNEVQNLVSEGENETQKLANEGQTAKNEAQKLANGGQTAKNEAQKLVSGGENEAQKVTNGGQKAKNEAQKLTNRGVKQENEAQKLVSGGENEAQKVTNGGQKAKNEAQKIDKAARRNKILNLIIENNQITKIMLKDKMGLSKSTIERDLIKLKQENKIEYIGSSKKGYWKIKIEK